MCSRCLQNSNDASCCVISRFPRGGYREWLMLLRTLLFLILFLVPLVSFPQERKKVGVVLSGGGAKGLAHIGVLKVIERAGIPVDYIVGTSMGAIVGGLYSIGYNFKL